ncbi:MAG: pseudouridine synthase [Pirellulaceae bacterium]|nr:pseudouridine synthase [Pirellulaceae bacterium]
MARPPRRKPSAKSSQRPPRGSGRSGGRSPGGVRSDEGRGEADAGPDQRLQKVLAAAGIGSRRDCEEYIREGRVEVDRKVVTELGTKVDPLRQEIRVDGEALRQPKRLYFAINKPEGVLTTNYDPTGRPRVIDLVPTDERVFAVGRLDRASEGLILVTNDGEFANRITHPRYGVEKTYLVRVAGQPLPEDLAKLQKGVYLSDGFCRVQSITVKSKHGRSTDLLMVLNEGRNRELRRVLAKVGHKVLRLKRIAVGSIKLGDLEPGAWRKLLPAEIETLLALAREKRKATKTKKKKSSKPGGVKPVGGEGVETPYVQKQALLAQPLTLADLLKDDADDDEQVETLSASDLPAGTAFRQDDDDLDDEALAAEWPDGDDDELAISSSDYPSDRPGEVLAYEEDEETATPLQPAGKRPDHKGSGGKGPAGRKPAGRPPRGETSRYAAERPPGRRGGKPGSGRPDGARPSGGKPGRGKQRPGRSRSEGPSPEAGSPARGKFRASRPSGGRPSAGRPSSGRPSSGKPRTGRPSMGRPGGDRPSGGRASEGRPNAGRPNAGQPRGDKRGGPGGAARSGPPRSGPPRSGPPGGRPPGGRPSARGKFGKPGGKRKGRR